MTTEGRQRVHRRLRRLFRSVRGRATVTTVVVSALLLALLSAVLLLLMRDWTQNRVWRTSEQTVERVVHDIVEGRTEEVLAPGPDEAPLVQIVAQDGRVVQSSPAARGEPSLVPRSAMRRSLLVDDSFCPGFLDRCVWVYGLRLQTSPWGLEVMVVAAAPLPSLATMVALPLSILLVALGLLMLIAWWTWHIIGRAFVPVDQIRSGMADFTAQGLGHRVPVPQTGGEIQSLAETVNATLERLEEATDRERRFVSDASHDLRNPIAGLQLRLEVALAEPADSDWKPLVRAALRDTQRLHDIVIDLLELSRLDSRAPVAAETIDLADFVRREIDRRACGVPVLTRLEPGAVVRANRVRLGRVLNNLLSNAERHSRSGIEVTVVRDGADAVLEVLDDGPGIPAEARERVFERFSRLPESRALDPQGTGLGLPIAREIAEIHGGSLRLADSPHGARFVLRLPISR